METGQASFLERVGHAITAPRRMLWSALGLPESGAELIGGSDPSPLARFLGATLEVATDPLTMTIGIANPLLLGKMASNINRGKTLANYLHDFKDMRQQTKGMVDNWLKDTVGLVNEKVKAKKQLAEDMARVIGVHPVDDYMHLTRQKYLYPPSGQTTGPIQGSLYKFVQESTPEVPGPIGGPRLDTTPVLPLPPYYGLDAIPPSRRHGNILQAFESAESVPTLFTPTGAPVTIPRLADVDRVLSELPASSRLAVQQWLDETAKTGLPNPTWSQMLSVNQLPAELQNKVLNKFLRKEVLRDNFYLKRPQVMEDNPWSKYDPAFQELIRTARDRESELGNWLARQGTSYYPNLMIPSFTPGFFRKNLFEIEKELAKHLQQNQDRQSALFRQLAALNMPPLLGSMGYAAVEPYLSQ